MLFENFRLSFSRLLNDGQSKLNDETFAPKILPSLQHLIIYICQQCDDKVARNYAQQQLSDIQNELQRIRCMINYYILDKFGRYLMKISQTNLTEMKMLTNKAGPFTKQDYQRFEDIVKTFKSETFLSGFNLIQEQALSITDTLKMESGHWFACQNDHVYNTDQVSKSPIFLSNR